MSTIKELLKECNGILRLAPAWVPRSFCRPAKRIKLHPDDYYVLGLERGGIDERWFASTTHAENGPDTPEDEGLSYIVSKDGESRVLHAPGSLCTYEPQFASDVYAMYYYWVCFILRVIGYSSKF